MLLPNAPWAVNNMITADDPFNAYHLFFNYEVMTPSIDWSEIDACEPLGAAPSDYDRFTPPHSFEQLGFLSWPWDITMHASPLTPFTNLSFLFLAFCPLVFLKTKKRSKIATLFLVGGLGFWLTWALIGKGVIWYAFLGFPFLLIWLLDSLEQLFDHSKLTKVIAWSLLSIWILSSVFLRVNFFVSRTSVLIPYSMGMFTTYEYVQNRYPDYIALASIINRDDSLVYLTDDVFFKYFIENNHERVYGDQFLESFHCLYDDNDPSLFIQRLKDNGFHYLVASGAVYDPHFPIELTNTAQKLIQIASKELLFVGGTQNTYVFSLYDIPPPETFFLDTKDEIYDELPDDVKALIDQIELYE